MIDLRSFLDISARYDSIPLDATRLLASIEGGRGREELYRAQAPQVLERLAARTRFDSITASSAIEDVILDDQRALEVVRGGSEGPYRDRSEGEFAGYRDAVDYLLAKEPEPLSLPLILYVHRTLMRHTEDPLAGKLKSNDNFIGVKNRDGSRTVIFETVPAGRPTAWHLSELVERYEQALADGHIPPLLLVAALVVDLLAIHPFEEETGGSRGCSPPASCCDTATVSRATSRSSSGSSTRRTPTTWRCGRAKAAGPRVPTTRCRGPYTCCGPSRTHTATSSGCSPPVPSWSARASASRQRTTS